jgi:hypothetical protein
LDIIKNQYIIEENIENREQWLPNFNRMDSNSLSELALWYRPKGYIVFIEIHAVYFHTAGDIPVEPTKLNYCT